MKKIHLMIGAFIMAGAFTACSSSNNAKKDADNLSQYVDSVDHMEAVYTEANWKTIDEGYLDRNMKVEKNMSTMQPEDKETVETAKAKYAALKMKYEAKIEEAKKPAPAPDNYAVLRKDLFNDKLSADMNFEFVNAANIEDTYEKFVNTVEKNKNDYTKEDWDQVKVYYTALDARKEQLDKDVSADDKIKIGGLKTKYKVIKGVHRPLAAKD